MAKHEGLLLKIDSKGNISGYMQENNNKIPIENTTIKSPIIPSPAFTIICATSLSPVNIAAPIPIIYIQQLTSP